MSTEIVSQCSPACDSTQDVPHNAVRFAPVVLYVLHKAIERIKDNLPDTDEYQVIKTDLLSIKSQLLLASNRLEKLIKECPPPRC